MDPHRLSELRSIAYHRVIAERIVARPALRAEALARVARWREEGHLHPVYAAAWERVLALPDGDLCAVLTADDDASRALRQVTPLVGILSPQERWRIFREAASGRGAP